MGSSRIFGLFSRGPGLERILAIGLLALLVPPSARSQSASPAPAAEASPNPAADNPAGVRWQLTVNAPDDLRRLLETHLDLSRFEQSAGDERITSVELNRLIAATPAQARALLETEGYFNAEVRVERPGATPAASAGGSGDVLQLTLHVNPGPLTRVSSVRLEFEGPLSVATEGGQADAAQPTSQPSVQLATQQATQQATQLAERVRSRWSLGAGQAYTQEAWRNAKNGVISTLRAQGYTAATYSGTSARIDAQRQQAALYLVVDSGALYRFGPTRFEGLAHVKEENLRALMNYAPGAPLLEQTLLDYQDRLVKTTLFDSVAVTVDPDDAVDGATPVLVRLRERSLNQATIGAGVSANTGPRVTLEHLNQEVFGLAWQAKTRLQLGRLEQTASVDLLSHPQPGPYRNLVSGSTVRTIASGLTVTSEKLRGGRTQDTERIERLYYVEALRDVTRANGSSLPADSISSLTLNYHWVWRDLDSPVLPTRGSALSAEVGAGRSFHQAGDSGWFGRGTLRGTQYWTFGDRWYGQARLQLGQVVPGAQVVTVPYTLLFRAGGDESVRGYDYQTLGPSSAAGTALGGRVLGTTSVELARPISDKQPNIWLAGFVDAGNAAQTWADLSPKLGYGVGLRWRSPVGALKLDLAYGEALRKFRLHFTVGVTF